MVALASERFLQARSMTSNANKDLERHVGVPTLVRGHKIRVLFETGHPINRVKPLAPKEDANSESRKSEHRLEQENQETDEKASPSPRSESEPAESSDQHLQESCSSPDRLNEILNGNHVNEQEAKEDLTSSPVQERPGRDLRFGDLPRPRKGEYDNDCALQIDTR